MTPSSFLRLAPLSLLFAATAAARVSDVPTDSSGRPIFGSASQPLYYETPGTAAKSGTPSSLAESLATPVSGKADEPWNLPASPGGTPFWGYGIFGTQIGLAGLVESNGEQGKDLFVSATANSGFGGNNFWYVLNHNPATGDYYQVHVQPPYQTLSDSYYGPQIAAMTSANVVGGPAAELVVGLDDGRFFFYSLSTFQELGTIRPVTELNDFAVADLTGDGVAELLVLTESSLKAFNLAGTVQWSVSGVTGSDLVVAQMDADPALEIATTSGHVVDSATQTIQWTHSEGFGANLRAADIDGDSRAELIAAEWWYYIYAYDVDAQTTKWSYSPSLDVSAIEIANVDADPAPELLYGDNQHGSVHVLSLGATTPVEEWSTPNPDSGIPRIAVLDADEDGAVELIWGGGSNTTGEDSLNIFNPVTRTTEWQSIHLDGPFVSPAIGDVTGDGKPELVTASWESDSGYDSGRILVFDPTTLALLGISQPIAKGYSWMGLRDLKLRDIDGDGRKEIVVAADWLYDGIVEIYAFTDVRSFELRWETATRANGAPFTQADVLDVDGDGNLEVVAINDRAHTGADGNYLRVIDLATRVQEWRSPNLSNLWSGAGSMALADVDGDGSIEAVVALESTGIVVLDLKSRTQEVAIPGDYRVVAVRPGEPGFLSGLGDGTINRHTPDGAGHYVPAGSWKASAEPISGLTPGSGQSLWVSAGKRISLWPDQAAPIWLSADLGMVNEEVALYETEDGLEIYAGLSYGISGFRVGGASDFATVSVQSAGTLAEGGTEGMTLTFTRSEPSETLTTVVFSLSGQATTDEDYTVSGALPHGDGTWSVVIPVGETTAIVALAVLQDYVSEGPEPIFAALESAPGYFLGSPMLVQSTIQDDEPVVSVVVADSFASELRSGRTSDNGVFTLHRTGNLSRPLKVRVGLSGTALLGLDYRKVDSLVVFPKGKDTVDLRIVPVHDRQAEQEEEVRLRVISTSLYVVSEPESEASLTIVDAEPVVELADVSRSKGAMAINLTRGGGHLLPMTVTLFVTRQEENGVQRVSQQKVTFAAGSETAKCLVRPSARAKGPAQVSVQLIETGEFHLGNSGSMSFTLPTAADLR